jgi:PilZ domain-containing protein
MAARSISHHLPRYLIGLPIFCTYTPKGAQTTKVGLGWTRNISEVGACLELLEALVPSTPLSLVLQTEGDNLAVEATVSWVGHPPLPDGHTLHGVAFPRLSLPQREGLQALFRRQEAVRSRVHRLPVALPVQCHSAGAPEPALRGWTGSLSPSGCSLLLPERLPVGTLLDLILTTPRGDLAATGTVVWIERAAPEATGHLTRHGVRFTDPNLLRDLIIGFVLELVPTGGDPESRTE